MAHEEIKNPALNGRLCNEGFFRNIDEVLGMIESGSTRLLMQLMIVLHHRESSVRYSMRQPGSRDAVNAQPDGVSYGSVCAQPRNPILSVVASRRLRRRGQGARCAVVYQDEATIGTREMRITRGSIQELACAHAVDQSLLLEAKL